jgi:hypothetical protein
MKTIRLSRNLFSLTERLPKPKYRGRSNELRDNSAESSAALIQNSGVNAIKLKTVGDREDGSQGVNSKNSMRRHKSLDENSLPIIAN